MTDVYTFGEAMLRFSSPPGKTLGDSSGYEVHVAGAEANVATALASLGRDVAWASLLPDNPLGLRVLGNLKGAGIDCSGVRLVDDARLGTYFVDLHNPPRPTTVVYDRADSAVCHVQQNDLDLGMVQGASIVHLSGITPALSTSCSEAISTIVGSAKGIVSFDVNYRSKLWAPERAAESLRPLLREVDVIICPVADARHLFETSADPAGAAHELAEEFDASQVVVTSGSEGVFWLDRDVEGHQPAIPVEVVDRLGAGDALTAGILDGLLDGDLPEGVRRGAMLAAIALTTHGDAIRISRSELDSLLGGGSGGVNR